jgi:hypothetical protein
MNKANKTKRAKKRIKVKDLPTEAMELTKEESRKVKGGVIIALLLPTKAPSKQQVDGTQYTNTTFDDQAVTKKS